MPAQLPSAITPSDYDDLLATPGTWLQMIARLAAPHIRGSERMEPIGSGTNLVASIGDRFIIKVFPPFLRHQFESERITAAYLAGRLSVGTPAIVAQGEHAGWPFLVMTRLEGITLEQAWPHCSRGARQELLARIGALIAEVQAIPAGPLAELEPRWEEFLSGQVERCHARHAANGLPAHLLAAVNRYLRCTADAVPTSFTPAILTGEYTPENILVQSGNGAPRITGLIDFGDAMTGFREYDLLGPGTFLAAGDPALVRSLLNGYGYSDAELTPQLRARLMRLLLLHRYSTLNEQVRIDGWQERVRDIDELECLLWPFGA